MNKNKIYGIVFGALLVVYFLVKFVFQTAPEKNIDLTVLEVDTAQIKAIHIKQLNRHRDIQLFLDGDKWHVSSKDAKYEADESLIKGILSTLSGIKIQNIAATDNANWKDYQLTDSLATEVQLYNKDNKIIKDLMIGKFNYKANPSRGQAYGRQNSIQGSTYVRISGLPYSYLVDGFLSMSFSRDIDAFRNKTLLKIKPENIEKLSFSYPADSGFVLQKMDSTSWLVNQNKAENKKVEPFLKMLSNYKESRFAKSFKPRSKALYSISIEGKEMEAAKIKVYELDSLNYAIHSNQNSEVYFKVPQKGGYKRLLKMADYFTTKETGLKK